MVLTPRVACSEGVVALDELRDGVVDAITVLGSEFLHHKANKALLDALEAGDLDKHDYYRQLSWLIYRLIFLFVAEDRGALLVPVPAATEAARARYERHYSTKRLRGWAENRLKSPRGDLWKRLVLVMNKLEHGDPGLALPALGSYLWSREATQNLNELELANSDLLGAIRALCCVDDRGARSRMSFCHIGAEELGRIYEGLLELHPEIHNNDARFELKAAAGHERKTTGSYYTPATLIDCLLDSALDPALNEAIKSPDAERAILELKICDPACGSGYFLVAAARRIAMRLASVRAGGGIPSPPEVQRALRDVVGQCIYGVDLSPMAVELCKISLWLEAIEPGRPLSFLDGHIRQGNALLGATPALMASGIPDNALEPLEGDDKEVAKRLKKRNKSAREVSRETFGTCVTPRAQAEDDKKATFLADAWCAAFLWPMQEGVSEDSAITEVLWRQMEKDPSIAPAATEREVNRLARDYAFFHWHLAFPHIFRRANGGDDGEDKTTGWSGGFDVVIGNPPWNTLSPDAKEFFSAFDASIRGRDRRGQASLMEDLMLVPEIAASWTRTRRRLFGSAHFFKSSGRFTMFAPGNLGKGDLNVFRMFVELALRIVRVGGYAAQIVPDGLCSGANSMALRRALFHEYGLQRIFSFENTKGAWFPSVHRSQKFCFYSAQRGTKADSFHAAFGLKIAPELVDALGGAALRIPVAMVESFSPGSLAIVGLQSQREIDVAAKLYARWPKFSDEEPGKPRRRYMREIDMGNDRELFSADASGLPVYEGRMVGAYDHRAKGYRSGRGRSAAWKDLAFGDSKKSIQPQWYVSSDKIPTKMGERVRAYRAGFCDVSSPTNERTLVAALIPKLCVAGHTVPTLVFGDDDWYFCVWLAVANSFCMDFLVRQKTTLHVSYTILDSMPFPSLPADAPVVASLASLVLRLSCTGPEMIDYWNQMARRGWVTAVPEDGPPPGIAHENDNGEERLAAVAAIEAIVAHAIYGLTRDELAFVMDTFPILARRDVQAHGAYRTKTLVLQAYDAYDAYDERRGGRRAEAPALP